MSATVNNGIATLQFYEGLGYSPASGGPVGGLGVDATPLFYSTTYFGSDVKGLLPNNLTFGHKKSRTKKTRTKKTKTKKNKRSRTKKSKH